jgi:hypothetical protein
MQGYIIDGGSCGNLASKELCSKLKLKYYMHPNPYYISWLSDVGEMKITNTMRLDFFHWHLHRHCGVRCGSYDCLPLVVGPSMAI